MYVIILPYEFQTRNCETNNPPLSKLKINEKLKNLQINYFDFFREFCNVKKPKKLFYKFDPMHLSNKGHKKVFELIDREIDL